jgi:N-acylneuraminate cytidylyltransferase
MVMIIPARAGSKRVDNKALRPLAGKSLVQRAIERARDAGYDPIVATESEAIRDEAIRWGAGYFMRAEWTADDGAPDYTWARELPARFPDELVFAILRITSPFLAASHADRMCEGLANGSYSSMRCVTPVQQHPGKMWLRGEDGAGTPVLEGQAAYAGRLDPFHSMPTQRLPLVYIQTAGLEVTTAATLRQSLAGTRVGLYPVEGPEALDINTPEDWARAEEIAKTWTP